jgi:undecaprenyl diphosphate synthase
MENFRAVLECLGEHGVGVVTLYVLSTENWKRSETEIQGLLGMLREIIGPRSRELHRRGIRIRHLGSPRGLPAAIGKLLAQAARLTAKNTGLTVNIAFNYGGRREIIDAVRKVMADNIPPEDIDEDSFARYLYDGGTPDVDLFIRTGSEHRLSNFLLWQSSYSELYFSDTLWPDFGREETEKALLYYRERQRRFGGE